LGFRYRAYKYVGMFDVNPGRVFKNNKLEADGVLDYAKIDLP
jgi:hypothetical protein